MGFGKAAATRNASKSILFSTLKKGNISSSVATVYDRHITNIAATNTNQREPNVSIVTADANVEYINGRMSRLKFILLIESIANGGSIGLLRGRIAEIYPIVPITNTFPTADADAMMTDIISLSLLIV